MKKILSLLALVLMSCMGAWAETTEVTSIKASSIAHPVTYRMWLTDSQSRTCIITQNLKQAGYDADAEQARFAFIATGQLDEYYMYETVSQKYVKADNASNAVKDATRLVATPDEACKWKIVASTTQNRWLVSPKGRSTFMNFYEGLGANQSGQTIGFYTTGNGDQGSRWAFDLIEDNSVDNPTEWKDNTGYKVEALSTPALTSVAEGYYAILGMDQSGNNRYYLYDNGTKVQGKVWENAPELVWYVKSDGNGKYSFRNFKSGKYMTVGQGNGAALNMSESVANYNFLIQNGYAFIDDGTYGVDVASAGTNPTAWTGYGYTATGSRRMMVYPVKIVVDETPKYEVTYDVYFNDNKLYSEVVMQDEGSVATYALPEEYTYLDVEVPNVTINEAQTVRVNTSYNSNLPFVVGNYYNMTVREYNIYADLEGGDAIKSIKTVRDISNQAYFDWKIGGDWYNGFTFQNKSNNKYLSYGASASPADDTNANLVNEVNAGAKFNLKFKRRDNTDRWSLSLVGTTNGTYINRRSDNLSTWNGGDNALGEVGSAIVFTPAEEIVIDEATIETLRGNIQTVINKISAKKVGYPYYNTADDTPQANLDAVGALYEYIMSEPITESNYTEALAAYNAVLALSAVNLPKDGKAYRIHAVHVNADGTLKNDYVVYSTEAGQITGSTTGADETYNTFVAKTVDDKFVLVNELGNYLNWFDTNGSSKSIDTKGAIATYDATYNDLVFEHATNTATNGNMGLSDLQLFGCFQISGHPKNNTSAYQYFCFDNGNNRSFVSDTPGCKFYNAEGRHTFLFQLEEVENTNKVKLTNPNPDGTSGLDGKYVGTFSAPYNVELPAGVVAYKASVEGSTVTFTEIGNIVPKNVGVLVYKEGATENVDAVAVPAISTLDVQDNDFVAVVNGTIAADKYVLGNGSHGVGFYARVTASAVVKNKAYLEVPAGSNLSAFRFDFEDTVTGIEAVESNALEVYFDLQGRRVQNAKSGLYIVNGKKVIR